MRRDVPSRTLKIGIEERASLSAPPTLAGWGRYPLRGPAGFACPTPLEGRSLGLRKRGCAVVRERVRRVGSIDSRAARLTEGRFAVQTEAIAYNQHPHRAE
jgi:hypothetical protein